MTPPHFDSSYLETAITAMKADGVKFEPGLNDAEFERAETAHGFRFPPDLRALLAHALPTGSSFPEWRSPDSESLRSRLDWPVDGMCFDIEHNDFWMEDWGPQPATLEEKKDRAREAVRNAPFLIPVFSHRYLPATPSAAGNPVFSVYQTDIIYYGFDLASYLFEEFKVPNPGDSPEEPIEIELWSEVERLNR